ncbi:hypothetical protein EDD17DRAFT_494847 [Pisolithus thermaeus]|nr:hypothetical protein EV401DRAFT_175240 [Pisolithus croceorrhizus]KAI6163381.1 hypothetical protein EDD17DRAFT_494847 [Pisolithus thermaeus]
MIRRWVVVRRRPTLFGKRSASSYATALLDSVKDVGHPARHLTYPKATPFYEQLKPIPSVRYTKSFLFLTALAVSLAMDVTWKYWPQKRITVAKEDGTSEEAYRPRPISHRLLMLAMHLGIGASVAAYLVNKRRIHVHKVWLLPRTARKKQGKSSASSSPETTMDVLVKTYSWYSPKFTFTYSPDVASFVSSGENIVLRVALESDKLEDTFILKTKGALVDGEAVPKKLAKESILNTFHSKIDQFLRSSTV